MQNRDEDGIIGLLLREPEEGRFDEGGQEFEGGHEGGTMAEGEGGLGYQGFEDGDG